MTNQIETENQILSAGREFLPAVALKVLDKAPLTASEQAEYTAWLAGQIAAMERE